MTRRRGRQFIDITGQRFSYLVALHPIRIRKDKRFGWLLQCDCGNTAKADYWTLKSGHTRSCGCQWKELMRKRCRERRSKRPKGQAGFEALYKRYKKRAKERNLNFLLTQKQFRNLTQQNCWYCGILPQQYICAGVDSETHGDYIYNGIDRLDNNIGYTLKNCVSCCGHCNYAKADMTTAKFLIWVKCVYKNHFERDIE